MAWFRWLALLVGIALLMIIGTGAWLLSEPSRLRDPAERFLSELLARELRIDGRFELELGQSTTIRAEQVRLANPDWLDGDMLRIEKLLITLNLGSLLDDTLIIEQLALAGAQLELVKGDDGRANWIFGADEPAPGEDDSGPGFLIRDLEVTSSNLSYSGPGLDHPLELTIDSLSQVERADGLLVTAFNGSLNERPAVLNGELGPFNSLISGTDLKFKLKGQLDNFTLDAGGFIDNLADPRKPELSFELQEPDVKDLGELLGLGRIGEGPVDLKGLLRPGAEGLELEVHGNLGQSRIDVSGRSPTLLSLENGRISFDLGAPNLGRILAIAGIEGVPEQAFTLRGGVARSGSVLTIDNLVMDFADARFTLAGRVDRFPDLDGVRLDLGIEGNDIARFRQLLGIPGVSAGAFSLRGDVNISPEGKQLVDVKILTDLAEFTVSGPIGDPPDYFGTRLKIRASGDSFRKLAEAVEIPWQAEVPFELNTQLEVTGPGLRTREKALLTIGAQQLEVDGIIGLRPLEKDTDVRFRAAGPKLSDLLRLLQVNQGAPNEAYEVTGKFEALPTGYRLTDVRGQIGNSKFDADGLMSRDPKLVGSKLRLAARGPDLEEVLADTPDFDVPAGPFDISGQIERRRNSILIKRLRATGGRGKLSADADIGWPLGPDSRGRFKIEVEGADLAAVTPEFEAFQPDPVGFKVSTNGDWRGERWNIESLVASVAGGRVSAKGTFDQPPNMSDTAMDFVLSVPDLSRIGRINGGRPPALPLELAARFQGTPRHFVLESLDGRLGESDIAGRMLLDIEGDAPALEATLRSQLIDLRPFLPDLQAADTRKPEPGPRSERLIPDTPLPLEALKQFNAKIELAADAVRFRNVRLEKLFVDGQLESGALDLREFRAQGPGGAIVGSLALLPRDDSAQANLNVDGDALQLNLFGESLEDLDKVPVTDLDISLTATGTTLRQLASTLDGSIRLDSRGGRLRNSGLEVFTGDFLTQLLSTINPFVRREPYTEIVCVAAVMQARQGEIAVEPAFVVQTDKINVLAKGGIDLKRETLDVSFRTEARKGLGISISEFINPFFKVAGTLAEPKLVVDTQRAAVTGGAAILTAGISLLAKAALDRAFRTKDPCEAVLENAENLRLD